MAKRLSEKEIKVIVNYFSTGQNIQDIANEFDCTKATIVRNLKKNLGEDEYKQLINISKTLNPDKKEKNISFQNNDIEKNYIASHKSEKSEDFIPITTFAEIIPLNCEIENEVQKDLSSIPISEIDFPKVVYMIVDKKIELEIKYLKEYPDWQFLSQDELSRKTIQIFFDLKNAKRFCNKEQKVIKVPNTNVFRIVAPILLNKGISRIVTDNQLIAL